MWYNAGMTNTTPTEFLLSESGDSALAVAHNGVITVEKASRITGGVTLIHLSRDEAMNLFAALGRVLGRESVGNFVPVWDRG